jgi:hypothetical protein
MITNIVTRIDPIFTGILKIILSAMEPPSISAREVDTEAITAKLSIDLETGRGR